MFGIYDYTNDQMWTHGYKKKTGKQFLDFIKRMDQKYDDSIKQIFLILDNLSIHKSNKVKAVLSKYHPRIHLVFLPHRITQAESDRGKMAMDATTSNKQFHLSK